MSKFSKYYIHGHPRSPLISKVSIDIEDYRYRRFAYDIEEKFNIETYIEGTFDIGGAKAADSGPAAHGLAVVRPDRTSTRDL